MRGTPVDDGVNLVVHGIIPADAGNTKTGVPADLLRGDHPRGCGEHRRNSWRAMQVMGSSPRMRGTRGERRQVVLRAGIIPADAGNTSCHRHRAYASEDHPRGCGEHALKKSAPASGLGSSPRMRGARLRLSRFRIVSRIIPAYAGSTAYLPYGHSVSRDHPRGCGEHLVFSPHWRSNPGSSPRMRGAHTIIWSEYRIYGIIPADAGSTVMAPVLASSIRDHPRGCGEHSTS